MMHQKLHAGKQMDKYSGTNHAIKVNGMQCGIVIRLGKMRQNYAVVSSHQILVIKKH